MNMKLQGLLVAMPSSSMIPSSFNGSSNREVLDCAIQRRQLCLLHYTTVLLLWENRPRLSSSCGGKLPARPNTTARRQQAVCYAAKLNEALQIRPNHPRAAGGPCCNLGGYEGRKEGRKGISEASSGKKNKFGHFWLLYS